MSTRKQFIKVVITGCPIIPRGTNTQGGTVIGDYVQDGNRYIVVEMPKVEKKAPVKRTKSKSSRTNEERALSGSGATALQNLAEEVTHGA